MKKIVHTKTWGLKTPFRRPAWLTTTWQSKSFFGKTSSPVSSVEVDFLLPRMNHSYPCDFEDSGLLNSSRKRGNVSHQTGKMPENHRLQSTFFSGWGYVIVPYRSGSPLYKVWKLTIHPSNQETSTTYQWLFLVPLIGGRWYISRIYCQLGDYMVPTTY